MATPNPITAPVNLEDLIAAIERGRDHVLDRLGDAAVVAQHLDDLSDHLLGHFVDQARRHGASWKQIGECLGVTKQAAQKRFVPKAEPVEPDPDKGFAAFTVEARNALVAAHDEAAAARSPEVRAEHLVLGLLAAPQAPGARALAAQGVSLDQVRRVATAALPPAAEEAPSLVPYDTQSRKALELAFREALRLGDRHVGTEHMLLAILEQEEVGGVLAGLGVTRAAVAAQILDSRSGPPGSGAPAGSP